MLDYFDEVDEINIKKIQVNLGNDYGVFYEGKPLKEYDCILAKGSFRYAIMLRSITHMLAGKCYMPFKASAFTVGHNKILTQLKLQKAGIPTPASYLAPSMDAAKKVLEEINYPIIIKFPEGTQGKGVMFADSFASASSLLDAFASLNQPVIIQEYVETGATDTRVIVVGDKVVASMQRKAEMGEKRANIHAGGVGMATELDAQTKKIAIKTAKVMNCDICAVDILESSKGPYVIEINLSPGLQGITKTTKIDVADYIARHIYKKTKEFKEENKETGTNDIFKDLGIDSDSSTNGEKEIIVNADMRGERLLLPSVASKLSKIGDDDEVIIKAKDGKLEISKL